MALMAPWLLTTIVESLSKRALTLPLLVPTLPRAGWGKSGTKAARYSLAETKREAAILARPRWTISSSSGGKVSSGAASARLGGGRPTWAPSMASGSLSSKGGRPVIISKNSTVVE